MLYSHRGASPISRFAANRDPDSRSRPNRETGVREDLFPDSGRVGNLNRGFPPRFPAKSGMGGTGIAIQIGDFRVCPGPAGGGPAGDHDGGTPVMIVGQCAHHYQ
jgi:hypothetical protein